MCKGQRRGLSVGTKLLEMETGGTLSAHVEVASAIRVGDTDRALELLDRMIDSAVLSLSAQPGPRAAAGSTSQAKVYRSVVPPSGASASSVKAAWSRVPPPEGPPYSAPERQGSALGKLVTRSAG
jgi:hypothetical protein